MLIVFAALTALARPPAPRGPEAEIRAHLEAIRTANQDIRELARAPRSSVIVQQIERKSVDIDRRLQAIEALVGRTPPPVVVIQEPVPPPPPPVPTEGELAGILSTLEGEAFPKQRLARLQDIAQHHWFTAGQVVRILGTFDFPDNQVEAAVALHPHVVDPESWYLVYDTFDFPSHRDEVRRRVGAN